MIEVPIFKKLTTSHIRFDEIRKNVPGVWMLLGRNNHHVKWNCLQVGINTDIYSEMLLDISFMDDISPAEPKPYINQFGEIVETRIIDYPSVQRQLYSLIRKDYSELAFCVVVENEFNYSLRKRIEKYVAYRTKAKYWRNGAPYKNKSEVDMKKLTINVSEITNYLSEINDFLNEYVEIYTINEILE